MALSRRRVLGRLSHILWPLRGAWGRRPPAGGTYCSRWSGRSCGSGGATRLLAVAADDRLAALWTLALHTGLRQGELLGLRWVDVDPERSTLTVLQTIQVIDGK